MTVFWCQGMFASGSTWLYNVALAVACDLDPRARVEGRFVFSKADAAGLDGGGVHHIVKAHQAKQGVEAIAAGADAIIVTLRDPRDAVVSLMQYQGFSFNRALLNVRNAAEACLYLGMQPQAVVLHYETGFVDDPATIDGVARHMGGAISPQRRDEIFQATRRPNLEAFIARIEARPSAIVDRDGDVYDLATHWHKHHAGRTGETGRWRRLLYPAQVGGIETSLADWMETFGYPPGHGSLSAAGGW